MRGAGCRLPSSLGASPAGFGSLQLQFLLGIRRLACMKIEFRMRSSAICRMISQQENASAYYSDAMAEADIGVWTMLPVATPGSSSKQRNRINIALQTAAPLTLFGDQP